MNDPCHTVRDELPLFAAGRLDAGRARVVERHIEDCAECRAEQELVALLNAPIAVPSGLEARIRREASHPAPRRAPRVARVAVAAGVAALAIAGSWLFMPDDADPAAQAEVVDLGWAARMDPVLHGGPGIDALSNEELELLLEEIET